ncbi:MAG: bifunctional oligoribonuclease/PAP phosphatase NrnA [Phycisphaerae bacterium]|nr:bifunctional oligoribonuclease/PAP phosphatase NrnA [Phycisphaerae bacterium]
MIPVLNWNDATRWLGQRKRVAVFSHRRPDGDALGSMVGAWAAAGRMGVAADLWLYEPLGDRQAHVGASVDWKVFGGDVGILAGYDGVIVVDTCATAQLQPIAAWLASGPPTLVIDHHATRDAIGTRPGDLQLVDERAGAASMLMVEWFASQGWAIEREVATALFAGIATDCGWFRFSNTDARMLRAAARLLEAGVQANELYGQLFEREPLVRRRLAARLVEGMRLLAGGKLAVMELRRADFEAVGADASQTEDLVNEPMRIAGVAASLLFIEEANGDARVNLRSKHTLDVAALAAGYGGGGHVRAAGLRLTKPWEMVRDEIVAKAVGVFS